MPQEFIERRDSGFYIIGSRVPIDRVVYEYRNGEEPVAIQTHYPTLSLDQVNGAITFYLDHKEEVEAVIAERRIVEDEWSRTHPAPAHLKEKLERARQQLAGQR